MRAPDKPVSVIMVGIGGYGYHYLKTFFAQVPADQARLCAVVDPWARQSGHYPQLKAIGIPIFAEIEECYAAGVSGDLAVIASPSHFHVPQSSVALSHGTRVLCDKPVAPVVQEADRLIDVVQQSGSWCMIGYQWSYSRAIQTLKRDIRSGLFGKPLRLKTLILWPRDDAYYRRNDWAGKIKDPRGRYVLDSPASNAMAHYLHNLFYLLGTETSRSATPAHVVAELYRVNSIENYDTAVCRARAECGAELLFYGSHATRSAQEPIFHLEFERAVISYNEPSPVVAVQTREGRSWNYGSPEDDPQFRKLFDAIRSVHTPEPLACPPEAARAQCVCVNGMQESAAIAPFPHEIMRRDEKTERWFVEGLDEILKECYRQNVLPSEIGIPWANRGATIDLRGYSHYPSGPGG